jgi:hypothetical protein
VNLMPREKRSRFSDYEQNVFVNCPFDSSYKPLFYSIVFTVLHCGFRPRCALEVDDASQVRIDKIFSIIEECRYGIHDISCTELDRSNELPRFNMPLELGIFLGAKRLGNPSQRAKVCLILDRDPHRYQKFMSDIAGQDIRSHAMQVNKAISVTRDWFRACSGRPIPGGAEICRQYARFTSRLPGLCRKLRLTPKEMTFNDLTNIATEWLKSELASSAPASSKR